MIIACPACATRYVVPDSAVGIEGRTVRCAKCRHSWFQEGHQLPQPDPGAAGELQQSAPPAPQPPVAPADVPVVDGVDSSSDVIAEAAPPTFADAPVPAPSPAMAAAEDAETVPSPASLHQPEAEYSQFEYQPPFQSRRNPLKIWTAAAVVFAAIAFGTIAAVSYWGLPDWAPFSRPIFAANEPDLVMDFPPAQQDRRTLPNGSEFFGAVGTITNVGRETRSVPSILIVMRDEREKLVYSWVLAPPKPALAPGEKMTVVEAVTDVPRSAKFVEIGWKPN